MTERLALNHISKAQLLATASTLVEDWPVQDDQGGSLDWMVLGDYDAFAEFAEVEDANDFSRGGYGGYEFQWDLMMSPKMLRWFRQQFMDGVMSAPVTVMTPDTTTGATDDEYRIVHATMHWYKKGEPRRSEYVPWWTYPFKFVDGRDATEGPDPTISITHAGALVVDTAKTYTVQVENVGDDTTFDDLIVVLTIGANSRYDDHTAVGWTVEFSINGGSSYSGTPPVDPADITHVRFTRALPLEAAATASFTVDIVPLAAGNITATVAASTVGDTDAGNNTDADTAFAYAPPVAAFSYDPVSGAAPLEVDFTDESTGNPVSWAWDIDDSGGAPDYTTQNPTHIYAAPDTYTVRLTVTNPAGSDDVTHDVVVS